MKVGEKQFREWRTGNYAAHPDEMKIVMRILDEQARIIKALGGVEHYEAQKELRRVQEESWARHQAAMKRMPPSPTRLKDSLTRVFEEQQKLAAEKQQLFCQPNDFF